MKFTVRKNPDNAQFYWHLESKGRIVCDGAEGYERLAKLSAAVRSIFGDSTRRLREFDDELIRFSELQLTTRLAAREAAKVAQKQE